MPALNRIGTIREDEAVICVLKDFNPTLRNPERSDNYPVIRYLKTLAGQSRSSRKSIILMEPEAVVPSDLREEMVVCDFPLPSTSEIERIITSVIPPNLLQVSGLALEQLIRACQGLTRQRIERILARALAAKGKVNEGDVDLVLEEKSNTFARRKSWNFTALRKPCKMSAAWKTSRPGLENAATVLALRPATMACPVPKGFCWPGSKALANPSAPKP
ncbi:hypothetical protein [Synechococcus sp. W70.1]|uniref:hypothetical protein n=1 Tax=Synechococcus sp. W70.1 TaxID=2964534 RepID=UPI0039C0BAA3